MHQKRHVKQSALPARILAGITLAMLGAVVMVATVDPTEALCAFYNEGHPLWYLYACWRFQP